MKKQEPTEKTTRKTRTEQYEEDLKVISEFTPEEATRAILGGAGAPKKADMEDGK